MNSISFGNPTNRQIQIVNQKTYLDDLFLMFKDEKQPSNESDITKHELNDIVERLADLKSPENLTHLKRYSTIDRNLLHYLAYSLKPSQIDIISLYDDIVSDVDSLIYKLKFNFQRPRPKTLAYYYKMKLFSLEEPKTESPSYPSRTVIVGNLICRIVGNREPKLYDRSKILMDDIISSRVYIGSNYATDVDFADKIAKEIVKNQKFAKKYAI